MENKRLSVIELAIRSRHEARSIIKPTVAFDKLASEATQVDRVVSIEHREESSMACSRSFGRSTKSRTKIPRILTQRLHEFIEIHAFLQSVLLELNRHVWVGKRFLLLCSRLKMRINSCAMQPLRTPVREWRTERGNRIVFSGFRFRFRQRFWTFVDAALFISSSSPAKVCTKAQLWDRWPEIWGSHDEKLRERFCDFVLVLECGIVSSWVRSRWC